MQSEGRNVVVEPGRIIVSDAEKCAEYEVYGNAPVQGFGTVLGRDIYFRARDNKWSFEVADFSGELPSDGFAASDGFYREATCANASWMPLEVAVRIIDRCLEEYVGFRPQPHTPPRCNSETDHANENGGSG
jgi:hypothetical protein